MDRFDMINLEDIDGYYFYLRHQRLLPRRLREKLNMELYCIAQFVKFAARSVPTGSVFLDAGSGHCPYKPFFERTRYVAVDMQVDSGHRTDVVANLTHLPFRDDTFDAILNTQVLEHTPDPIGVLVELHRVLKEEGQLFVTAPQSWQEHGAPHDYFRFTSFGLRLFFETVGFQVYSIEPHGGYFRLIGDRLTYLPSFLFPVTKNVPRRIIRYPLKHICQAVFLTVIPLICHYLDQIDRHREFTLGYACHCRKATSPLRDATCSSSIGRTEH